MTKLIGRCFYLAAQRWSTLLAIFLSIIFFLFAADQFVTERSFVFRLFPTILGFGAGLVGGGLLGWFIGGIGVVAMGTGVGIGAVAVVVIGSVAGAVFGSLTATSFSILLFLVSPSDYNVDWPGLMLAMMASAFVFIALLWLFRKFPRLTRLAAGEASQG